MSGPLACPECGHDSFSIMEITGYQEKAIFDEMEDGTRHLLQAGHVEITDYNPDELMCGNCGSEVGCEDLIPIEEVELWWIGEGTSLVDPERAAAWGRGKTKYQLLHEGHISAILDIDPRPIDDEATHSDYEAADEVEEVFTFGELGDHATDDGHAVVVTAQVRPGDTFHPANA